MSYAEKIIGEIETHSPEGIQECFENGVNPNDLFKGLPLIYELTSEYARSPQFKKCVQLFVDYGLVFDDKPLLAVLLDDAATLQQLLLYDPQLVLKKYSLKSAFTPIYHASLLHICAEYNHIDCARALVKYGADINARAGIDENGFGGQTPIFHTVNQIQNQSVEMLEYLLEQSADLSVTLTGLIWGKGYSWETLIPAVNPISYAMMGLLPQMHRNELTIHSTVTLLLKKQYGIDYRPVNVPCQYLKK